MSTKHGLLKAARLIHLYLGVFITPALIFFAFTGFIQTFSLHETTRGSDYKPPAILAELGQLHKKQTLVLPARRQPPPTATPTPGAAQPDAGTPGKPHREGDTPRPDAAAPARPADAPPAKAKNLLPMKLFFALVSVGLFISSVTGLYMSYKYIRNAALITALWIAGIILPVLLTYL